MAGGAAQRGASKRSRLFVREKTVLCPFKGVIQFLATRGRHCEYQMRSHLDGGRLSLGVLVRFRHHLVDWVRRLLIFGHFLRSAPSTSDNTTLSSANTLTKSSSSNSAER